MMICFLYSRLLVTYSISLNITSEVTVWKEREGLDKWTYTGHSNESFSQGF